MNQGIFRQLPSDDGFQSHPRQIGGPTSPTVRVNGTRILRESIASRSSIRASLENRNSTTSRFPSDPFGSVTHNERPRRKQRSITRYLDRELRKRRGNQPVGAVKSPVKVLFSIRTVKIGLVTAPIERRAVRSSFIEKFFPGDVSRFPRTSAAFRFLQRE